VNTSTRGSEPLVRRSRRTRLPVGDEASWPLHAKRVPTLRWDSVLALMAPEVAARVSELLATCVGSCARSAEEWRPQWCVPVADASKLLDSGAIVPFLDDGSPIVQIRYFSVAEVTKRRRRPIFWPRLLLVRSSYDAQFRLLSVHEYRQLVHAGSHAVAFDLASSFWQVALPADSRLVMRGADGALYRVTRLPFGHDAAPEIMQLITSAIAEAATKRSSSQTLDALRLAVHIDNVLAVGAPAALRAWSSAFVAICNELHCTLNEEPANLVNTHVDFVGMHFNFSSKTVALAETNRQKFDTMNDEYDSLEDLERAIGRVWYAAAVLGMSLVGHYFFVKWWRRRLSALARGSASWLQRPSIPSHARTSLQKLLEAARQNVPSCVLLHTRRSRPLAVVVTDASLTGWGAVLLREGHEPAAVGDAFDVTYSHISIYEAAAAAMGLACFGPDVRGCDVILLVDNTSVEANLRRALCQRHIREEAAAIFASGILRTLDEFDIHLRVAHIPSASNAADAISRARPLNMTAVADSWLVAVEAADKW
jgi:hypothetical protein